MLSIKAIKAGGEDYYLDLAAEDYYFNGGEPPGKWMGGGCRLLGLARGGKVERNHLKRLFRGYHPTVGSDDADDPAGGPQPLVQNAGKKNRTSGLDLTFSLPKSVSVIWSQADDDLYRDILNIGENALAETLTFAEEKLGFARTGKQGQGERIPAKLTYATFEHATSRACDPQLHWHALLTNIACCSDGKHRAVDLKPFFKNKMLLGAIFRSKVAYKLRDQLGLKAVRHGNCFDVRGVPQKVIDAHSTRAKQIRQALKEKGLVGAKAAAVAAVATRAEKEHRARQELLAEWKETNQAHGFNDRVLNKLINRAASHQNYRKHIPKVLQETLKAVERRYNHFTELDFLKEALFIAPEYGIPFEDLAAPVGDFLRESEHIVPIPAIRGRQRYAATSVLEQETELLTELAELHGRTGLQVEDEHLIKVLGKNSKLSPEQREAVRHVTQGEHAIRIVQGYAGTGKTTMLEAAVEAWKKSDFNVVGVCFTGKASKVLEDEIEIPCQTINLALADFPQKSPFQQLTDTVKHHAKQLARELAGRPTFKREQAQPQDIDRRTIVLVDEAGMVGTRHMSMLMKWANDNHATLVLTGDEAQLPSVEGGSPLMSMTRRIGCTKMTDIKRQHDYWARKAAYYFARGEVAKAVELYDQRGLLKVQDDTEAALQQLLNDWETKSWDRLESTRIITTTNDLVHEINQAAQQRLIQRGTLDPRQKWKIKDIGDGTGTVYESEVHVGDRVIFKKNDYTYDVRNGEAGTVLAFTGTTKGRPQFALKVLLDDGRTVIVPRGFEHIRLGYASTVETTQGETVDEAYLLLAGGYHNLPRSYVQGTRARLATHLYTTRDLYDQMQELEESLLVSQMEQEVDLTLAADLFLPVDTTASDLESLREEVIKDWQAVFVKPSCLIVTRDESQADYFNRRCGEMEFATAQSDWETWGRFETPESSESSMPFYEQDGKRFVEGSRVRFSERGRLQDGTIQDELGTVTELDLEREKIEIELDRDIRVSFPINDVPALDHGYAVTEQQVARRPYRHNLGLLVDAFGVPFDNPWDFSVSKQQPTVLSCFTSPTPMTSDATQTLSRFQKVKTYQDATDFAQRAVDHQQKIAEAQRKLAEQQKLAQQLAMTQTHATHQRTLRWGF